MPASFLTRYFPKGKFFRDPVYGFIFVPEELLKKIVDNPLFQRLRWISQMSFAQMVFPSAVHSRFEHSLGVMHLAAIAAESFRNFVEKNREILLEAGHDEFVKIVEDGFKEFLIAAMAVGLLHDIGHAPFSHTFEMAIEEYDHEQIGYLLTEEILQDEHTWVGWVKNVLNKGKVFSELSPVETLLRNLIDGPIDIDKGDYLLRDSYHCGLNYGEYGHDRLWRNLAIIPEGNNQENLKVGVTPKAAHEAYHLIITRFHMYQAIYEHHTKQKIDAAMTGVLRLTRSMLTPSLKEIDTSIFRSWTDGYVVHKLIEFSLPGRAPREASSIMEKIHRRKLPQKSRILDEITFKCPKKLFKQILKGVKRKMWQLVPDDRCPFFPYLYIPQSPFPVEQLVEINVFDPEKREISSLYDFFRLNATLSDTEKFDFDNLVDYFSIKAFSYSDDDALTLKEGWAKMKEFSLLEEENKFD